MRGEDLVAKLGTGFVRSARITSDGKPGADLADWELQPIGLTAVEQPPDLSELVGQHLGDVAADLHTGGGDPAVVFDRSPLNRRDAASLQFVDTLACECAERAVEVSVHHQIDH